MRGCVIMLQKHCCGYLNQDVSFKKELTHSLKIVSAVRRLIFNRVEIFNSDIWENVQYLRFGKGCRASSIFYFYFVRLTRRVSNKIFLFTLKPTAKLQNYSKQTSINCYLLSNLSLLRHTTSPSGFSPPTFLRTSISKLPSSFSSRKKLSVSP